jgi:hypothetical protein
MTDFICEECLEDSDLEDEKDKKKREKKEQELKERGVDMNRRESSRKRRKS